MEMKRNTFSVMVTGAVAGVAYSVAPAAMAGFQVIENPETPYAYQAEIQQKPLVERREERVFASTANIIQRGEVDSELALVPVAGNNNVALGTALRGLIPEGQNWRVYSTKGVDTRMKVDWHGAESWIASLDGVMLKHRMIAEINWETHEITIAPQNNRQYAAALAQQSRERGLLREVKYVQVREESEPVLAMRVRPAQAGLIQGQSDPVATVDVPAPSTVQIAQSQDHNIKPPLVQAPSELVDKLVGKRVDDATRERVARLDALEAEYHARLARLNEETPAKAAVSYMPVVKAEPVARQKTRARRIAESGMPVTASVRNTVAVETTTGKPAGYANMANARTTEQPKPLALQAKINRTALAPSIEAKAEPISKLNNTGPTVSLPVQMPVKAAGPMQAKWEISPHDKTLRNALRRLAARNGFSLSYQTKDQPIKAAGAFFGTFDETVQQLERATNKRIHAVETRILGRILLVTD